MRIHFLYSTSTVSPVVQRPRGVKNNHMQIQKRVAHQNPLDGVEFKSSEQASIQPIAPAQF